MSISGNRQRATFRHGIGGVEDEPETGLFQLSSVGSRTPVTQVRQAAPLWARAGRLCNGLGKFAVFGTARSLSYARFLFSSSFRSILGFSPIAAQSTAGLGALAMSESDTVIPTVPRFFCFVVGVSLQARVIGFRFWG